MFNRDESERPTGKVRLAAFGLWCAALLPFVAVAGLTTVAPDEPGPAKAAEPRAAETKAADTKALEVKPAAETKAVEGRPVAEPKAVETRPAEYKPAEPRLPPPSGSYNIRCWQEGRLLFEQNGVRLPAESSRYGVRISGTDRYNKPVYVAETKNATCLIRSSSEERSWSTR
jgi:hypothetical protein